MPERLFSKVAQTNCYQPYFYFRFSFSLTCLHFFCLSLLHYVTMIEREIYSIIVKISFSFQNRNAIFKCSGPKNQTIEVYKKHKKKNMELPPHIHPQRHPLLIEAYLKKSYLSWIVLCSFLWIYNLHFPIKISLIHLL